MDFHLQRTIRLMTLDQEEREKPGLVYWRSRPPEERRAAVEFLRRQVHGSRVRLRRVIGSLIAHGVEFVIVGAYALAFHGAPRFTGDLDVFARPTLENASRLLTAVEAFGFPIEDLRPEDLIEPRRMLQMGVEPVQIHVMTSISGVSWDDAWTDRAVARLGSHEVPILGRTSFLRNKRAAGRAKDLADIEAIEPPCE